MIRGDTWLLSESARMLLFLFEATCERSDEASCVIQFGSYVMSFKAIWSSFKLNLSNHQMTTSRSAFGAWSTICVQGCSRYSVEIAPTVLPKSLVKSKHPSCHNVPSLFRLQVILSNNDDAKRFSKLEIFVFSQFKYVSKALWCPLLASKCCATLRHTLPQVWIKLPSTTLG